MYQINIVDVAGLTGCILFVGLLIVVYKLGLKVMRPEAKNNKEDYLAQCFILELRLFILGFSLVPFGFFAFVYLSNHPHVLDFLIFK